MTTGFDAEMLRKYELEIERLTLALHKLRSHPDFEYMTVVSARKTNGDPPKGEGWEPNDYIDMGPGPDGKPYPRRNWERFEFTDEEYWRRKKS